MKKLVFYTPVIVFTLFYGLLALNHIGVISPIVIVWLILFIIAGILISRAKFWGSLLGMLPAIHLIYMSTLETVQVVSIELPLGIIILLFYALCGYFVYKKNIDRRQ